MVLDFICDFHRPTDSVVCVLASSDFAYEGHGYQKCFSTEITDCKDVTRKVRTYYKIMLAVSVKTQ